MATEEEIESLAREYAQSYKWPAWELLAPGAKAQARLAARSMLAQLDKLEELTDDSTD